MFVICFMHTGAAVLFAQPYQLDNEKVIYTFHTSSGKIMTLCADKDHQYIVYRFGTKNKMELEYPRVKDASSWQKFSYSYWLRGGGAKNDGIDLNYLAFTNNNIKYVIYQTYFADGNKSSAGIRVYDQSAKKEVHIRASYKSVKGTLTDLRFDRPGELIGKGDELYD